jgi:hypothetical protein
MYDMPGMSPFQAERRRLEAMLEEGEPFSDVEAAVAAAPLSSDEQAALWLLGWALEERRAESREGPALLPPWRPTLRPVPELEHGGDR